MNEIPNIKKLGCVVIVFAISLIAFSAGLCEDISLQYVSMLITVPTLAAMILIFPTPFYALFPIAAGVALLALTKNVITVVMIAVMLILAAALSEGVYNKRTKFETVTRMASVMFFAFLLIFAIAVFKTEGSITREAIISFATEISDALIASANVEGQEAQAVEKMLLDLATSIPGYLLMVSCLLSYFSCVLAKKITYWFQCDKKLFEFSPKWEFEMPVACAYVFLITYALLLFAPVFNFNSDPFNVVVFTILYPLIAGMIVVGIKQIVEWIDLKPAIKILMVVLIIFGTIIFSELVLSGISFIGVYRSFSNRKEKKSTE